MGVANQLLTDTILQVENGLFFSAETVNRLNEVCQLNVPEFRCGKNNSQGKWWGAPWDGGVLRINQTYTAFIVYTTSFPMINGFCHPKKLRTG